MFSQLKNIDSAFKLIRSFCFFIVICSILLCFYAIDRTNATINESKDKIYVLANGKILEAFSAERKDNIPVEARDHIKMFHSLFFTLDPDDEVIKSNTTKAMYLADVSAKTIYDNLKENGYYANVIAGNISQRIRIDSIMLDINQYPFFFRCFAEETITRVTSRVTRNLITEGYLRNITRSDNNPHGFLIEHFAIVENKDIKAETR